MAGCSAVGCSNRGDKGFFMKSFPRNPVRRALWASQMKRDYWQPTDNSRLCEVHFDDDQWEKTRQDGSRKLKCNAVPTLFDIPEQMSRKGRQGRKFIIPLNADAPLISNVLSKDKSEAPKTLKKYSEDSESRQAITDEETENFSSVDLKFKSELEENSMNFIVKPLLKSILRRNCTSAKKSSQNQAESSLCSSSKTIELSNFALKTERVECSAMNCRNQYEAHEAESMFYKFPLEHPILLNKWLKICDQDFKPSTQSIICRKHFTSDCFEMGRRSVLKNTAIPTIHEGNIYKEAKSKDFATESESTASVGSVLRKSCESLNNQDLAVQTQFTKQENSCCRLCASRNGEYYIPIFGDSDLQEKISRCLPIIVLPTDNLPSEICEQCSYNLNISYKLIIGSLKADSFLRSEFSETINPEVSERPLGTTTKEFGEESATKDEPMFRINGPIKCDLCDLFFQDMNIFDKHIETAHLLQWRCTLCDHSFETSQELLAHKTLNHSGQIVTCESCEESDSFGEINPVSEVAEKDETTDVNLESELSVDDGSELREIKRKLPDLNCTKCNINFENAKQFRKHHMIHLPRRIKCTVCFKRCPSIFDYLAHVRAMHKKISSTKRNTVHGCKYCKKIFLIKQQLIIHLRKHKKEMLDDPTVQVYKCVTCPKKFVDRALYQKHRNVHDPACWHKFRCEMCNRSFMDKFKLKIHESIHNGAKPYQCDVCGRTFNRNANMIRHRTKHFEQTCRHCEKTFVNTQSLREHLRDIHGDTLNPKSNSRGGKENGTKPNNVSDDNFVCGYCGKQLTSYYSLLDHERIHTGDKPYVCERCGKAFRSITARWDHMVRHEKGNYVCELCGKIMSNKLNLRRHLRKHAAIEQRRFECKECGKLFHLRWRLKAHLVRIHHLAPSN